jgi:dynamin 1-like protein
MAIVNERAQAAKPTQVDPKTGKPLPARAQSPSLDTTGEAQNQSGFFGSFWASKNKKKMAAMEAPPPTLKASASLSERETSEVEVISKCRSAIASSVVRYILIPLLRVVDHLILQHRQAYDDRHGPQGYHVHPGAVCIPTIKSLPPSHTNSFN